MKLLNDKPMLLIGSPMCTDFCAWTHINHSKMPKEVVHERMKQARMHLSFRTKLYALQIQHGRYFLHEHPLGATSWKEESVRNILRKYGVVKVSADQCQYGLISRDQFGKGLARKAIGFMTNSPCLAQELQRKCPNRYGRIQHRHVTCTPTDCVELSAKD